MQAPTGGDAAPTGRRDAGRRLAEALGVRRAEIEARLVALVTPDLVAEHRASPAGDLSPALAHVLAYLRQAPTAGKLAIHAPRDGPYRVLRLSGAQGVPHEDLGPAAARDAAGTAADAAAHDVFLRRLRALGAPDGT